MIKLINIKLFFSIADIVTLKTDKKMALPSILYWEDPVTTGGLFGSVLVVLLSLTSYSLITVVSYSCLTALLAVLGVKLYSYVMVMMKKAEPGMCCQE